MAVDPFSQFLVIFSFFLVWNCFVLRGLYFIFSLLFPIGGTPSFIVDTQQVPHAVKSVFRSPFITFRLFVPLNK
jgi:hypothetical protein